MIPTMILFGLAAGRWPITALIAAALIWPVLLLAGGTIHSVPEVLGASTLSLANAGVGVLVHQVILQTYRRLT